MSIVDRLTEVICEQCYLMQPMYFFKPPPPVGAGGGYMFSGRPSVRVSVRDSRGSFMFP